MPVWFGRSGSRRFAPLTWQGWLVTTAALIVLLVSRLFFDPQVLGLPHWTKPVLGASAIVIFLLVALATSEP
jgi:hypothetical protein